ncbi:MAG: hypothetical protein KUG69_07005 [Marinosulfonomonas sp.]|nr:hypothetical protein [Marinosulfonomonas sp.]
MPLPLAPVAGIALRYGAIAFAAYTVARKIERGHFDQRADEAMDDVNEGLTVRREKEQLNTTARYRRAIRFGADGPGVEIDITALDRIRLRKI